MRKTSKKRVAKKTSNKRKNVLVVHRSALYLGIIGVVAIFVVVASLAQSEMVLSQHTEGKHPGGGTASSTIVVTPSSLDTTSSDPGVVATDGLNKWFLYNDTNDTIDNTLGTFVTGPATPFYGTGSVEFTLAANPLDRKNIATYQFSGTSLASISHMSFGTYSHSGVAGSSEDPFLNFNVDFSGSSSAFQKRLVYVPSENGTVTQDTWQKWDAVSSGSALWTWSGYVSNGNKWPDSNTNQYRSWSDIVTAFPNARILPIGGWLGIRVGEPGPANYTADVDFFSITKSNKSTTFDFEPMPATPSASPTPGKNDCDKDGWKRFRNPFFRNQGQCIDYVNHHHGDDDHGDKNNKGNQGHH
jgi:hypothetical protein